MHGTQDWKSFNSFKKRPLNSPIKRRIRTHDTLTAGGRTITRAELQQQAMDDTHRMRIVPWRDFLDALLPVDTRVLGAVLERVVDELFDKKRKEWGAFPPAKKKFKEGDLYGPFVRIANRIAIAAREEAQITPEDETVVREAAWKDYHAQPPACLEKNATLVRPDCALAMSIMQPLLDDPSLSTEKKEKPWWLQLIAAVEGKRDASQNDRSLILQLLTYLRLIMVEQKDRRFVFGLFLSRSQISVWLHDRSGVLGMDVPIDIHKNPKGFVQVIAALAILPAHRLGFDTTMKLAREPLPPIHTYRLSSTGPDRFSAELYKKNSYETQWVISMKHDTYMTLKAMSVLRTDVVVGSGCMVWAAVRYQDRQLDADKRPVFVVKQWWKSEDQADEGAIYEHLARRSSASPDPDSRYIGAIECHETVEIDGEADSTDGLIQRHLRSAPAPPEEHRTGVKRDHPQPDAEASEWLHVDCITEDFMIARYRAGSRAKGLQKRTRKRLVMNMFGCSIKFFATLRELLTFLLHGVSGHRYAYVNGVIQRDISPANLLIALRQLGEGSPSESLDPECRLIDFDHAKRIPELSARIIPLVTHPASLLSSAPELERVTEAVVQRARHLVVLRKPDNRNPLSLATIYVNAAIDYHDKWDAPLPSNVDYDPAMLGWDVPLLRPPVPLNDSSEKQALRAPRSGTPPYASVKILNSAVVRVGSNGFIPPSKVLHDAVHDIESFFWVLLYLCITRSGPGGGRRDDLEGDVPDDSNAEQVMEMRRVVFCFFDGETETIASNKAQLFSEPDLFETGILCHVHPYFEPLKPLLRQWWDLLLLAYEFEGYEYHGIHKFVIGLLEKALRDLPPDESPDDVERERKARERRDEFVRKITHADLGVRASQTELTTPPTSPNALRVTTAFNATPEAQQQQQPSGSHEFTSSPTSPSPAPTKKAKRA